MAKIHVTSVVQAPVERVWEYIRNFNDLPKWFPGVTDSHIEAGVPANQVGCIRNFGLEGGPRIREQLLALSDLKHVSTYKMIETPLPIANYVATVQLHASEGNGTLAEMTSQFDTPTGEENEIVRMLTATYQGAFELLKKHFGKE
jgi:uncharacterized protein YndB with AHSA1/START domain